MTDVIEKRVVLRASPARVWRAISDHRELGAWFGATLQGPFVEGAEVHAEMGEMPPPEVFDDLARKVGLPPAPVVAPSSTLFCVVERVQPETYLSFRWVPFGIDAAMDPNEPPTTLVEFVVEPHVDGTLLTIRESGFDRVPAHRRERAFRMDDHGWTEQAQNVRKHVEAA